jgi:DNA-binding response OmpR family regulator
MNHKAFAQKMSAYSLLCVEDDVEVRSHIVEFLKRYFKKVYACSSAEEGLKLYYKYKPTILLLDINLGKMSGIELATRVREEDASVRILISTAYTNKEFMLEAIELSLTRYLVKPVTSEELVKALEKCSLEIERTEHVQLGQGYRYYKKRASIVKGKQEIRLRHKEVELLEYFLAHEGEILRYEQLEDAVWREEVMTRDAIRSQIRNLRKKLELNIIKNISGLGYKFNREKEQMGYV